MDLIGVSLSALLGIAMGGPLGLALGVILYFLGRLFFAPSPNVEE